MGDALGMHSLETQFLLRIVRLNAPSYSSYAENVGFPSLSLRHSPKNLALCSWRLPSGNAVNAASSATPQHSEAGESPKSVLQMGDILSTCELARKSTEVRGAAKSMACGGVQEPGLESLSEREIHAELWQRLLQSSPYPSASAFSPCCSLPGLVSEKPACLSHLRSRLCTSRKLDDPSGVLQRRFSLKLCTRAKSCDFQSLTKAS